MIGREVRVPDEDTHAGLAVDIFALSTKTGASAEKVIARERL